MIRETRCIRCAACVPVCPQHAITLNGAGATIDRALCTRCGACVDVCYADAREQVGRLMSVAQVMAEIERDIPFFDESGGGVTFSGGEPLMQPDFLHALLQACRVPEIRTAVDTSGYAPWKTLDRIRNEVDLFLYDLKLMDESAHRKFTGVPNDLILSNLKRLAQHGHRIAVRVAIVPGINDDPANIRRTAEFVASLPGEQQVDVLPYHDSAAEKYRRLDMRYSLTDTVTPPPERISEVIHIFETYNLKVTIGG